MKAQKIKPGYAYGYCSEASTRFFDDLDQDTCSVTEPQIVCAIMQNNSLYDKYREASLAEDRIYKAAYLRMHEGRVRDEQRTESALQI